jgi:nuclear pore complex protein Nup133
VVVVPTGGKVTYWESISSAATLDLRLQRNGVELTIPGMYNGETVIQILNAESAGFVLAFSTGRIAYMSVRDGQGRPSISMQFLRGSSGPVNGGLFGTLRNALSSSSWRGDIAAVRAGRPEKVGERNVVVATAKGKIQSWEIHRGGHNSLNAESEGREAIVMAIKASAPALSDLLIESFEVLDVTFTPKSPTESQLTDSDGSGIHLLLLASLAGRYNNTHYFLVEIALKRSELSVGNIRPIKSYTTPISQTATSSARLYLPNPALVAYVVFDRAVVVISMAKQPDSPDLQLRTESHLLPQSFEDVVDFRQDMNVEIVGSGLEEPQLSSHSIEDSKSRRHKAKYPATVLIVRGGGVIRVAATDITKLASSRAQQVTAKSKLEQAVFFGTLDQNPLNFAVRAELQFPAEEVGAAALELSRNILKSETPCIPSVPASIDQNLRKRSAALCDLAKYLKASGVQLDRVTRWKLLWDAEKMTAASIIWKRYDDTLKGKPAGQKRGLLAELVECIHEEYKTEPVPESGELDRVRQWFIKDIWNLEIAVPWAFQVIKYTFQDGQKEHSFIAEILSEADDLVLGALQGAFDFRTANLDLYGLGAEELEYGILKEHFDGLPEFWTSTLFITENTRKQAELAGQLVKEYYPISDKSGAPSPVVVNKVRHEYSDLIDVAIRSSRERMRWSSVQESPKTHIEAEQLNAAQEIAQDEQILLLASEIDLPDEAIALAEKHEILPTLATVLRWQIERFSPKSREPGVDSETLERMETRVAMLRHQVRHCFAKFGTRWATALFEHEISSGSMADLLDELPDQQEYLTKFLRSKPEYAKISWINEITREKNFGQASKTLLDLGLQREQDVWSKKIELSMGKLAFLANRSNSQGKDALLGAEVELASTEDQLALIKIQDQICDIIRPVINAAIDENAELELALQGYGNQGLKKQQALLSLLEDSMGHLIKHEAMDARKLIDLLTLMGDNAHYDEFLRSEQFYLALQASRHGLPKDEQLLTRRVIWRRCMLVDNWVEVNDTDQKYDEQVSEQLRRTALYMTFRACLKNRKLIKIFESMS